MSEARERQTIVFFDGICHLCDGFVDFAISRDKTKALRFAPLQGETAKGLLPSNDRVALESILFLENGILHRESAAILRIASYWGFPWSVAARVALIVPAFLRDGIYRWIARNRYRWFGQREFCRLPTKEERGRLLE